eukprot:TRINITY_DN60528_c0_g2_i1.p1 TRINITY_DN60528_c0_g2~~TRINITY_DN60528_c0_g2_i1.p1  ORF type:complete len:359 (+),score=67.21 TRINITY_DN60528_c0_g2_i1:72-1148(+)
MGSSPSCSCDRPCGGEEDTHIIFSSPPSADLSSAEMSLPVDAEKEMTGDFPSSVAMPPTLSSGSTLTPATSSSKPAHAPNGRAPYEKIDTTPGKGAGDCQKRPKVSLPGGGSYEGSWLGSARHGEGVLVLPDGTRYTGQFLNDRKNGLGTYCYPNGSTYVGQWQDDVQRGTGCENWSDGSTFEGEFSNGRKNGLGRFVWANGCIYEGAFEDNDMHGEGTYSWADGRSYAGQWQRNLMGIEGAMQWPDGRVYEGEFKEGKKHGEGTHWWPDGRSYRGQWAEGRQHNVGIARTSKGVECKGLWTEGKFIRWLDPKDPLIQKAAVQKVEASSPPPCKSYNPTVRVPNAGKRVVVEDRGPED